MDPRLIQLFSSATPDSPVVADRESLCRDAAKCGYIIHPDVQNEDVALFISQQQADLNSTFYKRWEDVKSRSRWQLFLDQVRHYATTYGSGYDPSQPRYIPNDGAETPDFSHYTLISPISGDELFERCLALLTSGAALRNDTLLPLCEVVAERWKSAPESASIGDIRNREASAILYKCLGRRPEDPVELLRFILFEATGSAILIKSPRRMEEIRAASGSFDFNTLSVAEIEALATCFYRFKAIFMALRAPLNRPVINRIRRLAPRLHRPFAAGFWEGLLAGDATAGDVARKVGEIDNFKIVRLIQAIRERLLLTAVGSHRLFLIRNGKLFLKPSGAPIPALQRERLREILAVLEDALSANLSPRACKVRFPDSLSLACPSSERNFVGNIPFGSSYRLRGDNFFCIYWRNEWGARDFDLSMVTFSGRKTGWNADYNTSDTLYSGDMTDASPEAAEVIYCKGECPGGVIYCNRYNGDEGSRFRFCFGSEEIVDLRRNYMVRPDSMAVSEMLVSDTRQKMVAIVSDGAVFLMDFGIGAARVSGGEGASLFEPVFARKAQVFLDLRETLLRAGFTEAEARETPDIDLSQPDKEVLLSLFSKSR